MAYLDRSEVDNAREQKYHGNAEAMIYVGDLSRLLSVCAEWVFVRISSNLQELALRAVWSSTRNLGFEKPYINSSNVIEQ